MRPAAMPAQPKLASKNTLTNGQLAAVTLGRLALNVAYRIVYPLQPFLADHLRVDLRTVSALVTVQVLASIASPLGGLLADTRGGRATMALGLALFCAGAGLCALSDSFGGFLAGYALIGLASALYQPAAQAYLSARTSYERRGWALGVFETSWAMAALLGVAPLMVLVQATGESRWSFTVLLAAGACSLALIRFGLPRANPAENRPRLGQIQRTPTDQTQEQIRANPVDPHYPRPIPKRVDWRTRLGRIQRTPTDQTEEQIRANPVDPHYPRPIPKCINWGALRTPRVLGMLALLFLSACAVDLILVVQGTWARAAFGANEAELGQVFGLLGVAELAGSLGSTVLVDRVGKKRAVLAGYTLTALAMATLPLSEGSWPAFLVLFFLFDLCFEFSIVSALPLASGVAPAVRGTVMALIVLTHGLGRALSSRVAEPLWSGYGIWANGLTAAALTLAGVLACLVFVKETEASG